MSAIWGQISFNQTIEPKTGETMTQYFKDDFRLDDIQTYYTPSAYMGCGIQYITKEAENEKLPIYDEELCFNCDCILDNRNELLNALSITDLSIPDGRLMYQAYRKWGIDCVTHFRGLFSIAIYNYMEKCLYLIADPTSSRCLYYHIQDATVTFSTLLKPIIQANPNIRKNELYYKDFLIAPGLMPNIVPNETPYQNVYKLNPASYLKITGTSVEEITYWYASTPLEDCHCKNAKEYGDYFMKLYSDCVHDALRSTGEISIAMSSGLDSASIGALSSKHLAKKGKTLYSYTYVPYEQSIINEAFPDHILDETEEVKKIAALYPNIKVHFLNNHGKNAYSELDSILDMMEIPIKAYANFPNLCEICHEASNNHCRILLTGQMGNSTLSFGYIDHILFDLYINRHYITFLRYLNRYSKTIKESRKKALLYCIRNFKEAKKILVQNKLEYTYDNPFLTNNILENYPSKERFQLAGIDYIGKTYIPRELFQKYLSLKAPLTYMGEYETKLGLKYNMIVRDPTKDERILRFCHQLPYKYFAYNGTPRWLINGLFKDLLPDSILNNWVRYGVQNSDCFTRLMRDWPDIQASISDTLRSPYISQFINYNRVNQYYKKKDELPPATSDSLLSYLIYICALAKHLEN